MKSYLSAALNTSLPSQLLSPKMDRGSGSGASGFNDSLSERSLLPTAKLLCVRPSVYFGSSCEGENMMDDGREKSALYPPRPKCLAIERTQVRRVL